MPLSKHPWVAKELLLCVLNLRIIPEKKFALSTPKFGILRKCCKIQSIRNVRNKNTSMSCQVLERLIYHLVLMMLFNHCHFNDFL